MVSKTCSRGSSSGRVKGGALSFVEHNPKLYCQNYVFQDHVHDLLDGSRYHRLFRQLTDNSKAAKMALLDVAVFQIKHEMAQVKKRTITVESMSMDHMSVADSMAEFNWQSVTEYMREKCPRTTTLMEASLPSSATMRRHHRRGSGKMK